MKKNKTTLFLLLIGVISMAFLFGFNKKEANKNSVSFNTERTFKNIKSSNKSMSFNFTPIYMTVKENKLSVLNYNTQKVLFLNNETGDVLDSLGAGRGEAPNENNRIYHFDYDNEFLYTFDVSKYSIAKTNKETSELANYYLDTLKIDHAQRMSNDNFMISYRDNKSNISFGVLDTKNQNLQALEDVNSSFEKIDDSWWIFDGVFDKSEKDNSLFYTTYYSNDIVKIDAKGEMVFKVKLIHQTPLIKLTRKGYMLLPSENSAESVLDTALDSNYLYVLSNVSDSKHQENDGKRVVDCYDVNTGKYSYSHVLPNIGEEILPLEIEVLDNTLYVLYEESIESFEILN